VGGAAQRPAYRAVAGSLKLAYSQFEELESFAKFGTRLDDATRKTIDHGQRIRVCLNQAESKPWSMVEQICVLLALTAGLFDPVPLEKMKEAEGALQKAAAQIPTEIAGRFVTAAKLSDEDRKAVLEIATRSLAPFLPPKVAPK
jgi:F-type H+-transporting ATPase subunit alpha